MKAPEKLYIDFRDRAESTWRCAYTEKVKANDIEYTRTDAFIKKADKFICSFFHPDDTELKKSILNEFHKYMRRVKYESRT